MMNKEKPIIAISACLLGEEVRYDGKHKKSDIIMTNLSKLFEFISFCPEVEMGLGIPRPPLQLIRKDGKISLVDCADLTLDHTNLALKSFESMKNCLGDVSGVIFKSRSPSCGLGTAEVHNKEIKTNGLWAEYVLQNFSNLPSLDSSDLENKNRLEEFSSSVFKHFEGK